MFLPSPEQVAEFQLTQETERLEELAAGHAEDLRWMLARTVELGYYAINLVTGTKSVFCGFRQDERARLKHANYISEVVPIIFSEGALTMGAQITSYNISAEKKSTFKVMKPVRMRPAAIDVHVGLYRENGSTAGAELIAANVVLRAAEFPPAIYVAGEGGLVELHPSNEAAWAQTIDLVMALRKKSLELQG